MGGAKGLPTPGDKGPEVAGVNLPNPLNPTPPGAQILSGIIPGPVGKALDPMSFLAGAKGGKGGGDSDKGKT